MTHLHNDPVRFADEAFEGFVLAHERYVRAVPGGVARSTETAGGQVALVIGGGSGHYPAFAGWVGEGFAHGAVVGNVFASPSAAQIRSVALAVESGGGVVFGFGNYAGDALNFAIAAERLRADGIAVELVPVTDDIASAPADRRDERRGIAGGLPVLKMMAAAAETGADLAEVARVGRLANRRTRTLGVAFGGCTLPGAAEPLFTVERGTMALGLGIHGERGLQSGAILSADETAALLVDGVLRDAPAEAGSRVAAVLNGLGSITAEELFVVYRAVHRLVRAAGLTAVEAEVGEFVTSFDMPGISLTLSWLDDELEPLWRAPADAAAYRKLRSADLEGPRRLGQSVPVPETISLGSLPSQACARRLARAFDAVLESLEAHEEELGRLDAVTGDGDHGIGMTRGARAAAAASRLAVAEGAGAGTVLVRAGEAWAERAGGTSGVLWGAALVTLGESIGDDEVPSSREVVSGMRWSIGEIQRIGGAALGDKTMVDAALPFIDELERTVDEGEGLAQAWRSATVVAAAAAAQTAGLTARLGRARTHGAAGVGSPDPGAISFVHVVRAVIGVIDGGKEAVR
jgi:dihydroxyacetone kinase